MSLKKILENPCPCVASNDNKPRSSCCKPTPYDNEDSNATVLERQEYRFDSPDLKELALAMLKEHLIKFKQYTHDTQSFVTNAKLYKMYGTGEKNYFKNFVIKIETPPNEPDDTQIRLKLSHHKTWKVFHWKHFAAALMDLYKQAQELPKKKKTNLLRNYAIAEEKKRLEQLAKEEKKKEIEKVKKEEEEKTKLEYKKKFICNWCSLLRSDDPIYMDKKVNFKCGKCLLVRYCNITCQTHDWVSHHKDCILN